VPVTAQDDAPEASVEQLQAELAALRAAQELTAKEAAAATAETEALKQQAVDARREAARASIGLPPQFAALMPAGDPADPKVAQAIEAFRSDDKFAAIFGARTQRGDTAPEELERRLGEKNRSPFSNPASRKAKYERMKGRRI
jgi:hypothetical protein